MKIKLYALITSFVMIFSLVNPVNVLAAETDKLIMNDSLLNNFYESEHLYALREDVIEMANNFEDDGFFAELSDVHFEDAYCVYVNANILTDIPKTAVQLKEMLSLSDVVWNIPVTASGKTVIVQISKALQVDDLERTNVDENEIEKIREKAGKWQVVSASIYEGSPTPIEQLSETLSVNKVNVEVNDCVLIGGESGIYSMLAVLIEGNDIRGAVSLERDITYSNTDSKTREVKEVILEKQKIYSLEEFSYVGESLNLSDTVVENSTSGVYGNVHQNYSGILPYVALGLICGGVMLLAFIRRGKG